MDVLRVGRAGGVDFSSNPKVSELGMPKRGEDQGPSSTVRQSEFNLSLPVYPIQSLTGLCETHPHQGGLNAFLSPPVLELISSRNRLTELLE